MQTSLRSVCRAPCRGPKTRETKKAMAIYHLHAKLISRKAGRSATGAAAYRAGERILDERTGAVHDYTHKQGIEHREIVLPSGVH